MSGDSVLVSRIPDDESASVSDVDQAVFSKYFKVKTTTSTSLLLPLMAVILFAVFANRPLTEFLTKKLSLGSSSDLALRASFFFVLFTAFWYYIRVKS